MVASLVKKKITNYRIIKNISNPFSICIHKIKANFSLIHNMPKHES